MITLKIDKSIQCNGDVSLFVSFPYDNTVVTILRNLPERIWHKNLSAWEVSMHSLDTLLQKLKDYDICITGNFGLIKDDECKIPKISYDFKTKPFNHQIDGFNYGITHDRWLLGDEQGLGKTKQVIDIAVARKIQSEYKHCLIVCGVNGLKWNWLNEIHTHSDERGYILGQKIKKDGSIHIGSTSDKLKDAKNIHNINEYFIITNVESLRNKEIQDELNNQCKLGEISIVAIDEIHKCKAPNSQQSKGILKLQPEVRIAMTGTPLMNTPLDLYMILKWLGYEKHAFYTFKNHYCIMGGFGGYEIVGYRYLNELQDRLNTMMLRRLKEDVLDLPDKLFVNEYVEMTPKQGQIYKEVTADIKANIDQIKIASNPLTELIRMRQATGYTGILSSIVQESAKLDRLEELIDEAKANNKKVVVFSNWTQMTHEIYTRLSVNNTTAIITGETHDDVRMEMVKQFQEGDADVIIGTIGAMGTGLTLTAGTVVIFVDEPWNMALKEQAIDRCHRIGTKENITIYTLMCKDTIDERIHTLIEKKGAMSDAIVDGKVIGNKAEIVDFLLS